MKRIGILTAGGDTPALNAAIHGAVVRANQLRIEVYGLISLALLVVSRPGLGRWRLGQEAETAASWNDCLYGA